MLDLTFSRAQLEDGQTILELGCGWGAITVNMARRFPNSKIVAISNSPTQREYINKRLQKEGLKNVEVRTHNVAKLQLEEKFDRIISIEMFEHMRNYDLLLKNISRWLKDDGKLFVHIFTHKDTPYGFEVVDKTDWMSKYFFSGGIMPSFDIFEHFQNDLSVENKWNVEGMHYSKTARAWLENMDNKEDEIRKIFEKHYGSKDVEKWWNYWRIFFMSCEELWAYRDGSEWCVGHYLLKKVGA